MKPGTRIRVLSHEDVTSLLTVANCIPVMEEVFRSLARGEVHQPLRTVVRPPGMPGMMGLMPAFVSGPPALLGVKAICVFPDNVKWSIEPHQGAVLLFSADTGELQAVVNAAAITAIRTAAASGAATRCLARPDAATLAIVGSGSQAGPHLRAMLAVRPVKKVRVASRDFSNASRFAERCRCMHDAEIEAVRSVAAAVEEADIVVTVTSSRQPVLERGWIAPGTHLNIVGGSSPDAREVDSALMAAASLFVDRIESAANESGDYLVPLGEGMFDERHIKAELGAVLLGEKPGRTDDAEITIFNSSGLAAEDLAAAAHVYRLAVSAGVGATVDY